MITLVKWDDRGEEINQYKANQDVADEVTQEVIPEVICCV